MKYSCPLCKHDSGNFFNGEFFQCTHCKSIWRNQTSFLNSTEEKERYQAHKNDVSNEGYQNFVMPIVEEVLQNHNKQDTGLDFGAGTGPVISYLLNKQGYIPKLYDPFFHPSPELLDYTYNYIISCEVIEHFHTPYKEFQKLYNLLKKGGTLYIMTHLYSEDIDFKNWYYKNDKTHVFFYHKKAIEWICKSIGFRSYTIDKRLICLKK